MELPRIKSPVFLLFCTESRLSSSVQKQVAHGRDITNFVREDVKAATTTIQGMKESGPATLERMRKNMEKAYQALPALKAMRG